MSLNPIKLSTDVLTLPPTGLHFTFTLGGFPPSCFSVVKFDYQARYNELYELDLLLVCNNFSEVELSTLLDSRGYFQVWQDGVLQEKIQGIICYAEQGEVGFRHTFFRLKLVPHLYQLTLRQNCRIFQQKSLQEMLQLIFDDHPIVSCRFDFDDIAHGRREYCVQYRETDFEFLQRLTGEEGIFFYFEQPSSGLETVVFIDNWQKLPTDNALPLTYNPHRQALGREAVATAFHYAHQLRPHSVSLKDYTFKNPGWQAYYQAEKADSDEPDSPYYHYYDYPGRFKDARGAFYTQARLDSLRRDAHLGQLETAEIGVQPGRLIRLQQHPTDSFNTLWQPIAVYHHGEQSQALEEVAQLESNQTEQGTYLTTRVDVIPRTQTYRANFPQKKVIQGTQTAIVVGPKGEEIFTDNQGRVKVQFHWDRYGTNDDHSSCWIRVASPWAGQGWGDLAIPRVGQEVIVNFQEGDPDQPIITGRVYNAQQIPPGHLPQSKTQMYIKSKTYKGEGYNSIMFDDATYRELFDMHAERDMNTLVNHDQQNHIKNDRTLRVDSTQTTQIGKGRTTQITTGNDIKSVLAGSNIETISLLKSIQAKEIFEYGQDRIELEVGKQTSITMDNEKILLRFGNSTILMNQEGIWLDAVHIGLQEKNPVHQNTEANEAGLMPDCMQSFLRLEKDKK